MVPTQSKTQSFDLHRLAGWWAEPEDTSSPIRQHAFLVCWLLLLCVATLAVGVPRLRVYGHDVFIALDGAWRVLNGQRPILDFYAIKGPGWYLLNAAGLALSGGAARGLGYTNTLVAVLLSVWGFLLLRRRMAAGPLLLACTALVLVAIAPFPLGEHPANTTFASTYNRYGYAFTGLVLLECFLPYAASRSRSAFGAGFSSGFACALLIFLKISYGLVALGLVGISAVLQSRDRARMKGIAAGFLCFTLPMLAYLRFDLSAVIHEYRVVAAVRGSDTGAWSIMNTCYAERYPIGIVLVLMLGVAMLPEIDLRRRIVLAIAAVAVIGADLLLRVTNTQLSELPLIGMFALLLMNEVSLVWPASIRHAAVLLCLGLLSVASRTGQDAVGLAGALIDPIARPQAGYRFQAPHLAALEFFDVGNPVQKNDNGRFFVRYTEEGIDLVRANSPADASVRGMGSTNPFPYALLRTPPRGGANDLNKTAVGVKFVPDRFQVLGNVDLLLIPRYPATERTTMRIVLTAYKNYLSSNYVQAAESPNWTLLRRLSARR